MDGFLPIFFCLIFPILWTIGLFVAGRWTATHRISIQRVAEPVHSPYYDGFDQET